MKVILLTRSGKELNYTVKTKRALKTLLEVARVLNYTTYYTDI